LAVVASGCVGYKPDTFGVSQVGGIGAVKFHLGLCSAERKTTSKSCVPVDETNQGQSILGFVVPKGSVAPATLTAVPGPGATAIKYSRNDGVADAVNGEELPPNTELVGYLSEVISEKAGDNFEWSVDAEFGLPTAADGGSFADTFKTSGVVGWRVVDGSHPPDRPIACTETEPPDIIVSGCSSTGDFIEYGVSDLKLKPPAALSAFPGAKATLSFGLDFATTVTSPPSFALSTASTLAGAKATLSEPNFVPGTPDATTHRAPLATRNVKIGIPANAKPGTYDVTLIATANSGGVVTQTAKLQVVKPKLGFKIKLDKAKGTAIVRVKVPSPGTLTVGGKGLRQARRKPSKARWVNLTLKPLGKTKAKLAATGSAKVKAKFKFKPRAGAAVVQTKTVTLIQQ